MVGKLTESEIDKLVLNAMYAHLACNAEGRSYVVPISYAFDGIRLLGITTAGMKVQMMRANPAVCVCVDDIKSLTDWRSAILTGKFTELRGIEAATATGLIIDKYGERFADMGGSSRRGRNVTPERLDGEFLPPVVYAIELSERSGRYEDVK